METILTGYFNDIIGMGDLSIHQDLAIVPLYGEAVGGPAMIKVQKILERDPGGKGGAVSVCRHGRRLSLYRKGTDGCRPGG